MQDNTTTLQSSSLDALTASVDRLVAMGWVRSGTMLIEESPSGYRTYSQTLVRIQEGTGTSKQLLHG